METTSGCLSKDSRVGLETLERQIPLDVLKENSHRSHHLRATKIRKVPD